jgi:predicted MFS family arabinose efflux permease
MNNPSAAALGETDKRRTIAFLNWAHALDHYVMLIYPTVVIGLQAVYARTYAELIALSTASFIAFGVFSLPAGWLADHWSRRSMMALFYFGCGLSLLAAGAAPSPIMLAVALFSLGIFAAIYHPVGMAMLIEVSQARGRTLAFNGVCGNVGAALAAGITAVVASLFGWRIAFFLPAAICLITGVLYLKYMPQDLPAGTKRQTAPAVALTPWLAASVFGLFIVIALAAGVTFNALSIALPKIVDERLAEHVPLVLVGGLATAVFMCGALAQLAVGRLVEFVGPHILLAAVCSLGVIGTVWAAHASGVALIMALALAMVAIYGQVTVNDIVIARYTADAWRGRVYAVRYFLLFITAGASVAMIALLHGRGGFDLVLLATAAVACVFFVATVLLAILVSGAETRQPAAQPAE